ncbi:MAG: hypothetical protein HY904_17360 [Deltaproteobacteria bacterium]|nr:hypothetical protein [Deltaproteobacteria bacterium]
MPRRPLPRPDPATDAPARPAHPREPTRWEADDDQVLPRLAPVPGPWSATDDDDDEEE